MRYPEAAKKYLETRGDDGVALNMLLLMRGVDLVAPDALTVNGNPGAFGRLITGPTATLAEAAAIPGVRFVSLVAIGGGTFRVTGIKNPYVTEFSLADIADDIGDLNRKFSSELQKLYRTKMAGLPFFTTRQIELMAALAGVGILTIPSTPTRIQALNPRHPTSLLEPANLTAATRSAWFKVCELYSEAYSLYLKNAVAEAAAAVEDANANAEFWDAVYNAVKAIRDFPADLPGYAAKGFFEVLGQKNFVLIAVVGAVVAASYFGLFGKGAAAAISKLKA